MIVNLINSNISYKDEIITSRFSLFYFHARFMWFKATKKNHETSLFKTPYLLLKVTMFYEAHKHFVLNNWSICISLRMGLDVKIETIGILMFRLFLPSQATTISLWVTLKAKPWPGISLWCFRGPIGKRFHLPCLERHSKLNAHHVLLNQSCRRTRCAQRVELSSSKGIYIFLKMRSNLFEILKRNVSETFYRVLTT